MMNGSRLGEHRKPRVSPESWMLLVGMIAGLVALGASCANDGKRETWQDCAGVYHEECVGSDFQSCEYEYYKECINE